MKANKQMTVIDLIRQKRWANLINVLAGASVLLLSFWGYRLYNESSNQESATLASVTRLQVADFKLIYDRWVALSDAQAQLADHDPTQRGLYIIDVRSPAQYSEGHIRGAVSMPAAELEVRIRSVVPPSRSAALLVLYCA